MGIILYGVWKAEAIPIDIASRYVFVTKSEQGLINLGASFSSVVQGAGLVQVGLNGNPGIGKSTLVKGISGRKRVVNPDLTMSTRDVLGLGTIIHADLGIPEIYKNPIDLVDLRRSNHAEIYGDQCLSGLDVMEHAGNCLWGRSFEVAMFLTARVDQEHARDVTVVVGKEFEQTQGFQQFLKMNMC